MLLFFLCSRSRSGSSWQSWPSVSASLDWHRSVSIMPRTMEVFCFWPLRLAMPLWLPSLRREQSGTAKTMSPSWHTFCRESKCDCRKEIHQLIIFKQYYVEYKCINVVDLYVIENMLNVVLGHFEFCLFLSDWITVWNFWLRPIVCQKQHFLPAHICPVKFQGLYSH